MDTTCIRFCALFLFLYLLSTLRSVDAQLLPEDEGSYHFLFFLQFLLISDFFSLSSSFYFIPWYYSNSIFFK
uniref:Putative ovule protein n=1 Tax=Solanum chacoense TaxID=4108 RepID=A0A0V0GJZ5_SOLCH